MEKNFLEVEYLNDRRQHSQKLIEILGRKDFTFAGGRKGDSRNIDTFIMSEEKDWITKEQEKAIEEELGKHLREIKMYRVLNSKYYNYK